MALSDWELWACAQHVLSKHGDAARDHAFDRIVDLTRNADEEGIATWQAIAARIEKLQEMPAAGLKKH